MERSRREELNTPSAAYDATILTLNYAGQIVNLRYVRLNLHLSLRSEVFCVLVLMSPVQPIVERTS
jgi:hypothetical protein